jgi:hypothetical protein
LNETPDHVQEDEFDEVLYGPWFTMARKGRFIYLDTSRTEEEHREILETLASSKDELAQDIERQIEELESILRQYEPFDIISNISLANSILDPETYKEYEQEGSPAFTEYVALLYLAEPYETYAERDLQPIPGAVLEDIQSRVRTLFTNQIFYLVVKDIDPAQTGPLDLLSELRFKTLSRSLIVRFPAYHHHLVDLLTDLFGPLQDDLEHTLGFSIDDALALSEAVGALVAHRFTERREEATNSRRDLQEAVRLYRQKGEAVGEFPIHVLEHLGNIEPSKSDKEIKNVSIAWLFFALGDTFSFTANEVVEESGVELKRVSSLLERLSLKFGEVEARYRFPAPTHPLMTKAFINHGERFLCPVADRICWSIRPAIEALWNPDSPTAVTENRNLWDRYDRVRSTFLEQKALDYLAQALKHAQVYRNLMYKIEENGQVKEAELDGLILLDSAILLVEAKAGTVSPPARRGAPKRMTEELKELVGEAYEQALRAKLYIRQADRPRFYLKNGAIVEINSQEIERIFLVTVTLDHLDALITNLYRLQEIGLFTEGEFPWAVSLTDLRVIAEIVEFPSQLVHYIERRCRLNEQGLAQAMEELDWFGHYLAEGLYFENGDEQAEKPLIPQLLSYTTAFDDYYLYTTGQRDTPAPRPTQHMPDLLREILTELEANHPDGYLNAACVLLNMSGETRESFAEHFLSLRSQTLGDRRFHDFTIPFSEPSFGITCMFAPAEKSPKLGDRLFKYCTLKKYQTGCDTWIGLGCIADSSEFVSYLFISSIPWQYSEDLENLVNEFLPPLDSQ